MANSKKLSFSTTPNSQSDAVLSIIMFETFLNQFIILQLGVKRSVNLEMSFWCLRFDQKTNDFFKDFCPSL